jgi:hypothetical protein
MGEEFGMHVGAMRNPHKILIQKPIGRKNIWKMAD